MTMVKKSISVTGQQAEWIQTQIASGNYGNESEVLRWLIQEQICSVETETIRAELIKGEKSGMSERTPQQIMAAARDRLKQDGMTVIDAL